MRKVSASLFVFASMLLFTAGMPVTALGPAPAAVEAITPEDLRMHLEFLASDELGGRYTLSPNFAISARYLASCLRAYGFRGMGDHGDFLQHFDVSAYKSDTASTSLVLTQGSRTWNYEFGQVYPSPPSTGGAAQGAVVFVGYGISSAAQKHDDYAGLDVKGKIVLIASGTPEGVAADRLSDTEHDSGAALAHGAVGMLIIPNGQMALWVNDKGLKDRLANRETVRLSGRKPASLPRLVLSRDASRQMLTQIGLDADMLNEITAAGRPLRSKELQIAAQMSSGIQERRITTQNVVGALEGTDPALKDEYVVFSAHYDHLPTGSHGEIFHGADDDGSGTVAVLAIARAMAMQRPRRSVLIVFHAGEELGLLGSEYNTDIAPVVPLDRIVADLNIDMIGRSKPPGDHEKADVHLSDARTVYLVGSDRINRELRDLSEATNSEFQKLHIDYYYDERDNPDQIYYRSDHWNYAKHNIPVIFYFDGVHADYHRTTDTVDKIDFEKMTNVTRLVFETGWRVANLDHRVGKK